MSARRRGNGAFTLDDVGVTGDHPLDEQAAWRGRHEAVASGRSITELVRQIQTQHQMIGDLVATEAEQIQRLQDDVGGYISAMRTKVQSLQDQITALGGAVTTAKADQMAADAQDLSNSLDTLEKAFAQDNPPPAPAPATPSTDPTGAPTSPPPAVATDPNAPPA